LKKTACPSRLSFLLGALILGALPLLQGCFPVAATGVGASALLIADRRTSGAYVEDESIEWKANARIREHFSATNHINVTSYNRVVLLTGEVQNRATRDEAAQLTGAISNVRGVVNELVVGKPSSLAARANDGLITSNVKGLFLDSQRFHANHVKVITEANVVFLMGLVTSAEADAASELASTGRGVAKVIRVFEKPFLSEQDAQRIDGTKHRVDGPKEP
jgi:osmotically-inducible protein OsmY